MGLVSFGLTTASILAALTCFLTTARLHAAEASETLVSQSTTNDSETAPGPKSLKQQVKVTAETNASPVGVSTNKAKPEQKSFQWNFAWEGWNGLHVGLSQNTLIPDPLAELRERIYGTNDHQILHLEQAKLSAKIGAKVQVDAAAYVTGNQFQNFDNGVELRRFRLYARGDCLLLMPVSYEIELGYIPNQFYIENSYLAFRDLPLVGEFKFGQFQTPMSLDAVTSSRDITMMELAAPLSALAAGVNAGFQIGKPVFDKRATWKFGIFTAGTSQDIGDASKDYGRAITRITGLPIYDVDPNRPESATLLHLGLSANILYSASGSLRYRSRPESHLAPYVIDTGDMAADDAVAVDAEAAWVRGRFSVQSEYLHSWVNEKDGSGPHFDGVYASASWFLTGETRPYDVNNGRFARVIPNKNFDWGKGGWGAWEVAGRYSYVNLNSADVNGGRLSMVMTGVNWYLHSHVKWRFEYGLGHVSKRQPEGYLSIFQTRLEMDF